MKYLIYARVSPRGDMEAETSIQMQIDICKEYVRDQKGEVIQVLYDEFYSGKNMNRPSFKTIMEELESGKAEWDTICVYKLSRMSRSLKDGAYIFEQLYKWNKGFVSVTERNLDFSTPSGRAMLGMLQVFNQFEREQTVENTKNKMVSIASKGLWPSGNPPYGYKRGDRGDNVLYVDPRRAEIVKDVFEMYASSDFTSAQILNKYKELTRTQLARMINNRVYLGVIVYDNHEYPGKHPALISEELFLKAQAKREPLNRRLRPKAQKYPYLLAGMLYCHCGHQLIPASAKSGRYHYYVCTDTKICKSRVKAETIETAAIECIRNIEIKENILLAALDKVDRKRKEQTIKLQPELKTAQATMLELEKKKDRLIDKLLSDNITPDAEFLLKNKLDVLGREIKNLQSRIEFLKSECSADIDIFEYAKDILHTITHIRNSLQIAPDDNDILRQALILYIDKIVETENHEFKFYFNYQGSSSKLQKWHPEQDLNLRPTV